ncbi:MAG: helix-turn-helix domain-containing protein [Desulfovibrio sp.]|jgi:transcriptional regulator with XRE-family HTH domain|nr:helix-turn-helix domain-containing protein [Desulfovibrio sp.]
MCINKLLGLRIRRLREAGGQTQDELAEKAKVSTKHLGEMERGRGNPSLRSIQNISAVLGVSLRELFDFDLEEKTETMLQNEITHRLRHARIDVLRILHRALKP